MRKRMLNGVAFLALLSGAACAQRADTKPLVPTKLPPRGSLAYLDAESQIGALAFGKSPPKWLEPTGDKILGVPVYARDASSLTDPQEAMTTFAYDPKWGLVAISQFVPADSCQTRYQEMLDDYGPPTQGEWPAARAVEWKGQVTRMRFERQGEEVDANCGTARLWRKWLDRAPNWPPLFGD